MHTMKKLALILLSVLLLLSLGGCRVWHPGTPEEFKIPEGHYRLVADFSNGSLDGELSFLDVPIKGRFYDHESQTNDYSREAVEEAVLELAEHLSAWTGLDFTLNSAADLEGGILVDWSAESTLLSALNNRQQNEEFQFHDAVSLNLFMMDTLHHTLVSNLPASYVYYCSEGQPLQFINEEDMAAYGISQLPVDEPYYGSYAYGLGNQEDSEESE